MVVEGEVPEQQFGFSYTRKDLILYALSLGLGSSPRQEGDDGGDNVDGDLRFLYEGHPHFSSLPIFCLTFVFWSNQQQQQQQQGCRSGRLPPFPPPLMSREQVIPPQFLLDSSLDVSTFPVIHTWESIRWEQSTPVPKNSSNNNNNSNNNEKVVDIVMDLKTISVQPKSIGTFVTSQSTVRRVSPYDYDDDDENNCSSSPSSSILCTIQSTVVVFGIPKEAVSTWESGVPRQETFHHQQPHPHPTATVIVVPKETTPILEWTYTPPRNQALLYRIASGDTNHIHVDTSVSELMGRVTSGGSSSSSATAAPLLHGLFTLGVAFRGILKICPDADRRIRQLEAKFTQPAFVGDTLTVRLWKAPSAATTTTIILFQVLNKETGVVLVDDGCATLLLCGGSEHKDERIPTTAPAHEDGGPTRIQQSRL
jgi:acyl dehydratase